MGDSTDGRVAKSGLAALVGRRFVREDGLSGFLGVELRERNGKSYFEWEWMLRENVTADTIGEKWKLLDE